MCARLRDRHSGIEDHHRLRSRLAIGEARDEHALEELQYRRLHWDRG